MDCELWQIRLIRAEFSHCVIDIRQVTSPHLNGVGVGKGVGKGVMYMHRRVHAEIKGGHQTPCSVNVHLILLTQDISLGLKLGWQP